MVILTKYFLPLFLIISITTNCSEKTGPTSIVDDSDQNTNRTPDTVTGISALWSFQGNSDSKLIDSSGNSLDGTIHGAQRTKEDGHIALKFDGENDYVEMQGELDHLAKLGDGSISVWFKLNSLPAGKRIYPVFYYGSSTACDFFDAANKGIIIEVGHHPVQYNSKRLYFTMWANGCTYPSFCFDSNHALEADKWYHFVAVVGPESNTGYLNGEEMTTRRYNFSNSKASQFFENARAHEALWLGRGYWDSEMNYLDGYIGDVRIYADPLTGNQIEELYQELLSK